MQNRPWGPWRTIAVVGLILLASSVVSGRHLWHPFHLFAWHHHGSAHLLAWTDYQNHHVHDGWNNSLLDDLQGERNHWRIERDRWHTQRDQWLEQFRSDIRCQSRLLRDRLRELRERIREERNNWREDRRAFLLHQSDD